MKRERETMVLAYQEWTDSRWTKDGRTDERWKMHEQRLNEVCK